MFAYITMFLSISAAIISTIFGGVIIAAIIGFVVLLINLILRCIKTKANKDMDKISN